MSTKLKELVELMHLERIDIDMFRGQSLDIGLPQLFGGHVLAQCLSAATQTVEAQRILHSFHGYFLRPGDANASIMYKVERLRDGSSFSARQVQAIQKGEVIFTGICSSHVYEQGFEHQCQMPSDIPPPEQLQPTHELYTKIQHMLPPILKQRVLMDGPIEMRPVVVLDFFRPEKVAPIQHVWFKINGEIANEDQPMHRYIAGYMSDFNLVTTALLPHGTTLFTKYMQVASIDHSIRFHADFDVNQWILYSMYSPWAGAGRGLACGRMFDAEGKLLASTSQEGLIRVRPDWL